MGGTLDSEHAQCQLIAAGVPAAIVSVDYGLLPENSTAGMLADCVAGFEWAWANAASSRLGGDARRVVVLGGSAGGALAYGVVRELVLKGEGDKCRGAVGVFPVTIHAMTPPDKWRGLVKSYGSELWETAPVVRGVDQNGVLGELSSFSFCLHLLFSPPSRLLLLNSMNTRRSRSRAQPGQRPPFHRQVHL